MCGRFEPLLTEHHKRTSSPTMRAFGGFISIIATIFDLWLVRKHELSICPWKHFRWLHALCIDHLSDETEHFRWLMSTLEARPNYRNLLFFQFIDRNKTNMSFGIILKNRLSNLIARNLEIKFRDQPIIY
jgi:hypothetical protein